MNGPSRSITRARGGAAMAGVLPTFEY
jgi:hypothetical protein